MAEVISFANTTVRPNTGHMLTCISCQLLFQTSKEQREHYKSDLHRFNLKRKVANLPPVTQEAFEQKLKELSNESGRSKGTGKSHLKKSKQTDEEPTKRTPKTAEEAKPAPQPPTNEVEVPSIQSPKTAEEEEDELIEQKIKNAVHLTSKDCLFCSHSSEDLSSNIVHMSKVHGFFIPDIEYLQDLEGLIHYLGEKVSVGNICLYCNGKGRSFWSLEAVQDHMRDSNHCKLLYDDTDLEEYSDFYDFSTDYENEESAESPVQSGVQVSDDGSELIFANGKSVGHRSLQVYYRQNVRTPETRDSVLLNSIFAQYKMLGYTNQDSRLANPKYALAIQQQRIQTINKIKGEKDLKDSHMKLGMKANRLQHHFRHQNPK